MATKSDLWVELRNAIKLVDESYKYAVETSSVNFATLYNTLQGVYTGSNVLAVETALVNAKNAFLGIIGNTGALTPIILELARVGYSSRANNVNDALTDIFNGMSAASETVKYRNMTNGSVTPYASNFGNGSLLRLVKNASGQNIESGQYQSGNVICEITGDRIYSSATDFREPAIIRGNGQIGLDAIDRGNSPSGSLVLNAKVDLNGLTNNAGWLTYSDNGTSITLTNWTLANTTKATHINLLEDNFRDGTNTLRFLDNNRISQDSMFWSSAIAGTPYILAAWVKPDASCDGDIDLIIGDITKTIAVSSLTDNVWNLVNIDLDEDCWYDSWKNNTSTTTEVGLELKNRTAGQLDVANLIFTQFAVFDSKYYVLLSGDIPFQKGDYFTMTDSSANTGRIQSTIARLFGRYLPHVNTGETYSDL